MSIPPFHKQARPMLRCQLPKTRGRLLTRLAPSAIKACASKRFNLYAYFGNMRFAQVIGLTNFNAFLLADGLMGLEG
jgi:hypothetical protein